MCRKTDADAIQRKGRLRSCTILIIPKMSQRNMEEFILMHVCVSYLLNLPITVQLMLWSASWLQAACHLCARKQSENLHSVKQTDGVGNVLSWSKTFTATWEVSTLVWKKWKVFNNKRRVHLTALVLWWNQPGWMKIYTDMAAKITNNTF